MTKWAQIFNDTPDSDSYGLWLGQSNGVINLVSAIHHAGGNELRLQCGTIPLNTWTHAAMTFDGASGQHVLYINGNPVSTDNAPGGMLATSRSVFVRREVSFLARPFNGLIDEVGIYSRALSAAGVRAIFNAA